MYVFILCIYYNNWYDKIFKYKCIIAGVNFVIISLLILFNKYLIDNYTQLYVLFCMHSLYRFLSSNLWLHKTGQLDT